MLTCNDLQKVVFVSSLNSLLGNVLLRRILNMYKMLIVLESQVGEDTNKVFLGKGLILIESKSEVSPPDNFLSRVVTLVRARWVSKLTSLGKVSDVESGSFETGVDSLVHDPESKLAKMFNQLGAQKTYSISVRNFLSSEVIGVMIVVKDFQKAQNEVDNSKGAVRALFC